jgi:hypothetical protein
MEYFMYLSFIVFAGIVLYGTWGEIVTKEEDETTSK